MPLSKSLVPAVCLLIAAVPCLAASPKLVAKSDRADGIYKTGHTVHWTIEASGEPPAGAKYTLKSGGLKEVASGALQFTGSRASVDSKFDQPNTMLLDVSWDDGGKPQHAFAGAVADPYQIRPAAPPPDDFDQFWKDKLAELATVPMKATLEKADGGKPGVDYQKITLDNIRGTRINGQIARPEQGDKFPALLIVQWAGVYPLQKSWVTDRAADGWLALNILPHELPIDNAPDFYKQQYDGPLKNYWAIGNDDRDQSYYLRMYLSCVRAAEYLKSRPDWNGKTLVVMGTSQGGQQTLAIAGLMPDTFTAALPFLPAACDMLAPDVCRASGFPVWYTQVHGKDPAKVRETSKYYDPANFARKIKCPVFTGLGLKDDLAPPASVLAAVNAIEAPKEVLILDSGHQDENGSQQPYYKRAYGEWLPALRDGKAAPIKPLAAAAAPAGAVTDRRTGGSS